MENRKKIILNYLPPARIDSPSIALSILKSFLTLNGYDVEIKYWNILLYTFNPDSDQPHSDMLQLAPFLFELSERHRDSEAKNRVLSEMQHFEASPTSSKNNTDTLKELANEKHNLISHELQKTDLENVILFGISSKFHAWIPGMLLAKEIKKRYPHIKIVLGGFGHSDSAIEVMKLCDCFDFALWGEGEYPLLELCTQLEKGSCNYEHIPRLVFRVNKDLRISTNTHSSYLDFKKSIYPDFDEYFSAIGNTLDRNKIILPLESARGCSWNKCTFCSLNQGYKYRWKSPESVVKEIEFLSSKHAVFKFKFVDNDTIGTIERFNVLLDLLLELSKRRNEPYSFFTEITHAGLNSQIIKKIAHANFSDVQIGYEALSDSILRKMNKKNSFADNLLFVKFALKYGLGFSANLMPGIPDETEGDLLESINNVHFLRFFLNNKKNDFYHSLSPFGLEKSGKYYALLSEDEKQKYTTNDISCMLPRTYLNHENRFSLFPYVKEPGSAGKWKALQNVEQSYRESNYTYSLSVKNNILFYKVYLTTRGIKSIIFDDLVYLDIVKETNDTVCSLDTLFTNLLKKYPDITENGIREMVASLKAAYLVYCDEHFSTIVSVIDITGVSLLEEEDEVRHTSFENLAKSGPGAVPELVALMKHRDKNIRKKAINSLGSFGADAEDAIPDLIKALNKKSLHDLQCEVIEALGRMREKGTPATTPLLKLLNDSRPEVRLGSAWALGEIRDHRATSALIETLGDPDSKVQETVLMSLGKIGAPEVFPHLIKALDSSFKECRFRAAIALGTLKDRGAVNALIESLNDSDSQVRYASAWALGEVGDKRAIEPLSHALNDRSSEVREKAEEALKKAGNT